MKKHKERFYLNDKKTEHVLGSVMLQNVDKGQHINNQKTENTLSSVVLKSSTSRIVIFYPERTIIPKAKLFQKK